MDTKKVLWIGGGLASVFLLAKMLNPRDIIKDEIKKTAEGVKDAFEALYQLGVDAGITPTGGTFAKSPLPTLKRKIPLGRRLTLVRLCRLL
ncbi:MAG: hypothetical protein NTV52_00015 [Acidobacteria bacterium]|nr:hypothetical protein [Acidobacteriota bacterium]